MEGNAVTDVTDEQIREKWIALLEASSKIPERLEAIEARLDALEARSDPRDRVARSGG